MTRLELLTPDGSRRFVLAQMQDLEGCALDEAPGGGYVVRIPAPVSNPEMGLLAKELD